MGAKVGGWNPGVGLSILRANDGWFPFIEVLDNRNALCNNKRK